MCYLSHILMIPLNPYIPLIIHGSFNPCYAKEDLFIQHQLPYTPHPGRTCAVHPAFFCPFLFPKKRYSKTDKGKKRDTRPNRLSGSTVLLFDDTVIKMDKDSDKNLKNPEDTVKALKMLWEMDPSDYPFPNGLEEKLKEAEYRLKNNRPPSDTVFCHGDFCLPEIFVSRGRVRGFIDWGRGENKVLLFVGRVVLNQSPYISIPDSSIFLIISFR